MREAAIQIVERIGIGVGRVLDPASREHEIEMDRRAFPLADGHVAGRGQAVGADVAGWKIGHRRACGFSDDQRATRLGNHMTFAFDAKTVVRVADRRGARIVPH